MDNYSMIGYVFAALIAISGGIGTLYKVITAMRKEREAENKKTLEQAHEYVDSEVKIIKQELKFQKELHNGKTEELSQKIEQLREDLQRQHQTLVELITKMIVKD